MLLVAAFLSLTEPTGLQPQQVMKAFNEPGCPALYALYADSMRAALTAKDTGDFCDGARAAAGRMLTITANGTNKGWQVFLVHSERGDSELSYVTDSSGKITGLYLKPAPPPVVDSRPLRWPLAAESYVVWGGDTAELNYHVKSPQQRRALDICALAESGKTYRTDGKRNEDYPIWGTPVLAAADGTVLIVVDGVPENIPGQMNPAVLGGNSITIEQSPGQVALYAHLIPGSSIVKVGQRVRAGETIGRVGNSGNSSEPHLHFHIVDSADMAGGFGFDPVFVGTTVTRDGKTEKPKLYRPRRGDRVVTK